MPSFYTNGGEGENPLPERQFVDFKGFKRNRLEPSVTLKCDKTRVEIDIFDSSWFPIVDI